MRALHGADQACERNDTDEFRQREDFADDAVSALHQGCTERDEISGDVGDEQSVQAEIARRIDEAAVERQQCCDGHGLVQLHGRTIPSLTCDYRHSFAFSRRAFASELCEKRPKF